MATHNRNARKRDPDSEAENQIGNVNRERSALLDELRKYFMDHVVISVSEQKRAKSVVEKIKQVFQSYIKTSCDHDFGNIFHQGSSYEGLKVIKEDEFDLLVPLKMVTVGVWEAVEATGVNGCNAPGYYFIKKAEKHIATSLDRCIVNGYLNPISTFRHMQSLVEGATSRMNRELTGIKITSSVSGPALTLNVVYGGNERLSVDIVPCIELGGNEYVAKRHPKAEKQNSRHAPGQNIFDQLWRRSYTKKEQIIVREMDWEHECRRTCLKILKTIQKKRGSSQLGMLSSYHLKTCMLHLNDDTSIGSWHQDNLHHRFKDLLWKLIKFLEDRNLPNFYNPSENLFEKYSEESLRNILRWLRGIMRTDQNIIDDLLHGRDYQDITDNNFQVFVRTTNGNTLTFSNMKKTTLVRELKQKIQLKTGILPNQQLLVFGGKNLEDHRSLDFYGIGNESTIQMTGRLRGG
ncbi:mitochondrial dynamics protein MID51-like [Anneissia japonica]|uniref:mitochondrial dynamics protein MID51-like n=1 Tax=Anneissia japonica TaxID=1529436 RepID=UPI001425A4A7|nr:mitochondrial dynamics protein MID51-like [Anneissia japonica]